MKFRKNKKGFTLVELVVVIAILAILASVATVATITILNNARKTPVQDALSSLKNQLQYYTLDDDYSGNLNGTASAPGLIQYLTLQMPDLKSSGTTAVTTVTTCANDDINYSCNMTTGLKSATFYCIVYTKYYKGFVKCTYDSTNKNFTNFTTSNIVKIGDTMNLA